MNCNWQLILYGKFKKKFLAASAGIDFERLLFVYRQISKSAGIFCRSVFVAGGFDICGVKAETGAGGEAGNIAHSFWDSAGFFQFWEYFGMDDFKLFFYRINRP